MKTQVLILCCGVFLHLCSCSKSTPSQEPDKPVPVLPSVDFPMTVGSYWKFHRMDSAFSLSSQGGFMVSGASVDTSTEQITVIARIVLPDGRSSAVLEMKNLTYGKSTTGYAYYIDSVFAIDSTMTGTPLDSTARWFRSWVPMQTANHQIAPRPGIGNYDSVWIKADSSIVLPGSPAVKAVYVKASLREIGPSSGVSIDQSVFFEAGIGLVSVRNQYYNQYSPFGGGTHIMRLQLYEYKIAP